MSCVECSHPLIFISSKSNGASLDETKVSILWPCGHQIHACCSEFRRKRSKLATPMSEDLSPTEVMIEATTRCPSCAVHARLVTHLFLDTDLCSSHTEGSSRLPRIAHLQRKLLMRSRDVTAASTNVVNLTRSCAALHAENASAVFEMESLKGRLPRSVDTDAARSQIGSFDEMDVDGLRTYLSQTSDASRELRKKLMTLRSSNSSRRARLEALRSELECKSGNNKHKISKTSSHSVCVIECEETRLDIGAGSDDDSDVVVVQPQARRPRTEAGEMCLLIPRSTNIAFRRDLPRDLPKISDGLIQASLDSYA